MPRRPPVSNLTPDVIPIGVFRFAGESEAQSRNLLLTAQFYGFFTPLLAS